MWWEREIGAVACTRCGWVGWGADLLDEEDVDPAYSYACPSCREHIGVWAYRYTWRSTQTPDPLDAETGRDELAWVNRRIARRSTPGRPPEPRW